jgi:biotin carboxylase
MPADLVDGVRLVSVDTTDHAALLAAVIDINGQLPINAITTTNDFFVPEAALMASELKLPGMGYLAASSARNKFLTRLRLQHEGLDSLNPRFGLAGSIEEATKRAEEIGYPLIAKPQNANDSIGVVRINSEYELRNYWQTWQSYTELSTGQKVMKGFLLEEFIDGAEFSLETVQGWGQARHVLGITAKEDFLGADGNAFTELSMTFPCEMSHSDEAADLIGQALDALGIICGVVHTEFRVTASGEIKLLEINPRMAGDMLGSHAVPKATGVDTAAAIVEAALGNELRIAVHDNGAATIVGLHASREGVFRRINTDELLQEPGVFEIMVWAHPGSATRFPRSNADLLGRMVVAGSDRHDAITKARSAYRRMVVDLDPA